MAAPNYTSSWIYRYMLLVDKFSAFALLCKSYVFIRQDFENCKCIMEFCYIYLR